MTSSRKRSRQSIDFDFVELCKEMAERHEELVGILRDSNDVKRRLKDVIASLLPSQNRNN